MKNFRRLLVLAAVAIALLALAWPWLDAGWYAMHLSAMPAPSRLPMPVADVKPRGLSNTWHAHRAPARRHEGIDIFAPKGTDVLSATEGVLLSQGDNALGGKVVWVLGPAGQRHYYAHLEQFAPLTRGQRVRVGTVLGTVGNTGNARTTPPHLHYGIYTVAGAINPFPLLAAPK